MKIRKVGDTERGKPGRKPKETTAKERLDEAYPEGRWHTGRGEGFDKPLPMRQPEVTKYSMRKRERKIRSDKGKPKTSDKSRRQQSLFEAAPHTLWIRKDIWAAMLIFKEETDRSLRSIVEEALYNFLIKERRVEGAEDLGDSPGNSSWRL